jgi:hypothetical protein
MRRRRIATLLAGALLMAAACDREDTVVQAEAEIEDEAAQTDQAVPSEATPNREVESSTDEEDSISADNVFADEAVEPLASGAVTPEPERAIRDQDIERIHAEAQLIVDELLLKTLVTESFDAIDSSHIDLESLFPPLVDPDNGSTTPSIGILGMDGSGYSSDDNYDSTAGTLDEPGDPDTESGSGF